MTSLLPRRLWVAALLATVAALGAGCSAGGTTTTVERTVESTKTVTVTSTSDDDTDTSTTEDADDDTEAGVDDDASTTATPPPPPPGAAPRNLVAGPAVKAALRVAFTEAHTGFADGEINGPLPGTTYYGQIGSDQWALATFSLVTTGTTDQPETFRRSGGVWHDMGDNGSVCQVPPRLMAAWRLTGLRNSLCDQT